MINKYKKWDLYDDMPIGFKIDKTAGSPLHGYTFITNGKSVLNNQKRALLKVNKVKNINISNNKKTKTISKKHTLKIQVIDEDYRKTVNNLARQKMKEKLLNDIMVDLTVCELEGWSKADYISEIKSLIGIIKIRKTND